MKSKRLKKALSMLLALTMIMATLLACPFTAKAVDTAGTLDSTTISFWADPENSLTQSDIDAFNSGNKTTMTGAVAVHRCSSSSSNYYLFLPSTADCNKMCLVQLMMVAQLLYIHL
jgi:hypothetical protein